MTNVLLPSRAQSIGCKPKILAARTKKSLSSIKEQIERLAIPWIDIDNSIDGEVREVMAAFENFEHSIDASVKWLLECPE